MAEIIKYTDGVISLSEEYALVREFKELIAKGTDIGFKELGVIWWCHHPLSPSISDGKDYEECIVDAMRNFQLPKRWEPDVIFKAAEQYYNAYAGGVVVDIYIEILRSYRLVHKFIVKVRHDLEEILDKQGTTDKEFVLAETRINALMKLSSEVPNRIKAINDAKDLVFSNIKIGKLGKRSVKRGGGEITTSMNPDSEDFL